MPLPTTYSTGTASVANGTTTVTFSGALLGTEADPTIQAGDLFFDPAQPAIPGQRIASVDYDAGTAELWADWPGTSMSGDAYEVRYVGDTVRSTAQTRGVLTELSTVQANGRGLFYVFDDSTTDSDPGAGKLRINAATFAASTGGYIDNLDANGATASGIIDSWDDSASTVRGQLWVRSVASPSVFAALDLTGSVVDGTGYRKLTWTYVGGSGSLAAGDEIMVMFSPKGDRGSDGIDGASMLTRVRAVSTTDITIATALNNGDSLDGVTLATNDLVLVAGQTDAGENGIYVVGTSPVRDASFDSFDDHPGVYISVMEGDTYGDTLWQCTSDKGGTIDTDELTFRQFTDGVINPLALGAKGDGSNDDTTALQAAIDLAEETGCGVFLPVGNFKITSPLSITAAIRIVGAGPLVSVIVPDTTITAFSVDSTTGPTLESFGVFYASSASSGTAAFNVTSSSGECGFLRAWNLRTNNAYNAFNFVKASQWLVDGCVLLDNGQAGLFVQNTNNVDSGDSTVKGCQIANPTLTGDTSAVVWRSSGGLRFINNKINNFKYGINVQLASGAVTGNLLITGNSIESVGYSGVQSAISFQRLGTTGTLHSVLITGNQINGWSAAIQVALDGTGAWLTGLDIVGNVIYGKTSAAASGVIVHSTTGFTIAGNVMRSGAASSIFITTGSSASDGNISANSRTGSFDSDSHAAVNTTVMTRDTNVLSLIGSLILGRVAGGTLNGNIEFLQADAFPVVMFRAGSTVKTQLVTDISGQGFYFDAPGGVFFRDTINGGGATWLSLAAAVATFARPVRLPSYTVSGLPSAATVGAGAQAYVTDSNTTTFNATVAGGGANKVKVTSDGTNWKVG